MRARQICGIIVGMKGIQAIVHKCEPPETGYWAEVPSLPGCVTEGETLEEVEAMLQDAVRGWFQSAWDLAMQNGDITKDDRVISVGV